MAPSTSIGYLACIVAVVCFGSNFVPAKRITMGDGVFFQFMMCNAIFLTSIPVIIYLGYPEFHPFAMLGGFLSCTGNMLCGPAIQLIGLGLGLLIWGSTNMLMGWASGTFGLFGLKAEYIANRPLNFTGVFFAFAGFLVFLLVKSESQGATSNDDTHLPELTEAQKLNAGVSKANYSKLNNDDSNESNDSQNKVFGSSLSSTNRRLLGLLLACTAGILFGCSFDPAQYIIDTVYDGNDASINYVFPHYCGILLSSWFYFFSYLVYHRYNDTKPYVDSSIIIPGLLSGLFWGIAEVAWFIANGAIGFSISFPIISFGPGFVGALWGIFLFKEIKGFQNLLTLTIAFIVLLPGLVLVGMSH
jgi:hypothetical protein